MVKIGDAYKKCTDLIYRKKEILYRISICRQKSVYIIQQDEKKQKIPTSIRCHYNNWHHVVIHVKQNGIVTAVHEISTASSDEMFYLMGYKIPNKSQIYIKNHQKFLQR